MAYVKLESDPVPPKEQVSKLEPVKDEIKQQQQQTQLSVDPQAQGNIAANANKVIKTSIDENVKYVNQMNMAVFESKSNRNSNSACINCLCTLWEHDRGTLIVAPCILAILLLIILALNHELLLVYFLSIFTFYMILIIGYIYGYVENGSIVDLFAYSMLYGGLFGTIVWIFIWLLALTNNILVGPFIFVHSGISVHDTANSILWSTLSCIAYGGLFPFAIVWLKSDRRVIEQCCPCVPNCKLIGFHTLKEYNQLQHILNLTEQQMDQFMASNENEIKAKLQIAMKRLKVECVATMMGYIGSLYMMSFLLKFESMNVLDSTLIFLMGYLAKDLIFGVLFGLIVSYIIGRRKLYQIRMNNKFLHYSVVMTLGVIQQCVGTILSGLYPETVMRMNIIYITLVVNVLVCIIAYIELYYQQKLLAVQLETLFIYQKIDEAMNEKDLESAKVQLSLSAINEQEAKAE